MRDPLEPVTEFERELTKAFAGQRVEAPLGFAGRVMARAEREPARGKLLAMPVRQWRAWAAGAVAAVIVMGALQGERVHQEHERRVQAQRQFEAAEQITDQALAQARAQVQRAISLSE
ncbi:MAG TPA: hypothetical protein VIJ65_04240 [Acidobacteriaceae bacterium]